MSINTPLISNADLNKIPRPRIVFSDFDGTLTDHTNFSALFLDILDLLATNSIPVVIVTGRSVSWGHFLLTHFPSLEHIIAEGGGIHTLKHTDGNIIQQLLVEPQAPQKLTQITQGLLENFPKLSLSADSVGRITDRAIELRELNREPELFEAIKNYLLAAGAHFSTSNVHLNFWCGAFDKMTAIRSFLAQYAKDVLLDQCVFFGDSLNDQSVFAGLPYSIGVANLQSVEAQMTHKPRIILRNQAHKGPAGVLYALRQWLT